MTQYTISPLISGLSIYKCSVFQDFFRYSTLYVKRGGKPWSYQIILAMSLQANFTLHKMFAFK